MKVEKVKGVYPDFAEGIGPSETVINIDGDFVSFGKYYFGQYYAGATCYAIN